MKASANRTGLRVVDAPAREDVPATTADADLLYGAKAISAFLGMKIKQVRNRIEQGQIPSFKIGGTICSRRSTLTRWLNELEKGAGS